MQQSPHRWLSLSRVLGKLNLIELWFGLGLGVWESCVCGYAP